MADRGAARRANPLRHSVRLRLVLWNMLTLAFLMVALGFIAEGLARSLMIRSVDHDLAKKAQKQAEEPGNREDGPGRRAPGELRDPGRRPAPDPHFEQPRIMNLQGRVTSPPGVADPWDPAAVALATPGEPVFTTVVADGESVRVISLAYPQGKPPTGVIQVPYLLVEVNRALGGLHRALLGLLPLALLGAAVGGSLLTSRALRPVRQITELADRIGDEGLAERLPVAGKDEFWQLADVLNRMLDRLQAMVERERRFSADASHELRTPLSVIKANTSLSLSPGQAQADLVRSMEAIDRTADGMANLVQDLLLLARTDSGQAIHKPTLLLLEDVLRSAIRNAGAAGSAAIALAGSAPGLCVVGDEEALTRLFTNLLQNAVRYTPGDGRVTVTASREGAVASVLVSDTGIGIAPEHLPHLGTRFYRVDTSRARQDGGTGLGLAICRSIVATHGGELTIESRVGTGTTVHVTLPAGEDAPSGE